MRSLAHRVVAYLATDDFYHLSQGCLAALFGALAALAVVSIMHGGSL